MPADPAASAHNDSSEDGSGSKKLKDGKFGATTQFVLGKNANDVYAKLQQQQITNGSCGETTDISNDNENSSGGGGVEGNKASIYAKYPKLFRYEADQTDRHWLNEHAIIKRKNLKCCLLALDDIVAVFKTSFKLASDGDVFERFNAALAVADQEHDKAKGGAKELFLKKLKPFSLPDFILVKLNEQYFKRSIKSF